MVSASVFLFGKPEWEIDLEKAKPDDLKALGENLKERLEKVAEVVEKMEQNGWDRNGGLYDIHFYKNIKANQAEKELEELGIKEYVDILEDEEEWEDEYEDEYNEEWLEEEDTDVE
ncbi:MAG: hypothetical protein ACE5J3_03385 [Methanosarcinales archaeon]